MLKVVQTDSFAKWFKSLRDNQAKGRIADRIDRVREGNLGDHKSVGGNVSELHFAFGPGHRVYFTRRGDTLVILLGGGTKRTQSRDIRTAQALADRIE